MPPFSDIKVLSKRKQQILDKAQELFSRKGYLTASMRDLAEELDIKPASLYSHYKSKEEILWEIALRCAREFHTAVLHQHAQADDPESQLAGMIRIHISVIVRNIDAAAIFFKEWQELSEPRRSQYKKLIQTYEEAFSDVLKRGIEAGVFRPIPTKFATSMLLSATNWIQHWYKPRGKMKEADVARVCKDFILAGLGNSHVQVKQG
ncbi:MAG: TetR/AcrR family transcriptional regulator [Bacteroidota bacterium]